MRTSKRYVTVKQFQPSFELKKAAVQPLLSLQIGDLIEVVEAVNDDWAFGCVRGSADAALFPLRCARPIGIVDELENATLNFTNLWWEHVKQSYASGASPELVDQKLDLISDLVSSLECRSDSNTLDSLPVRIDVGCDQFGLGLHMSDKNGQNLFTKEDHEFSELVQLVRQKRLELTGKKTRSTLVDNDQHCSFLIRLSFESAAQQVVQLDSELILSFVQADNQQPLYESYVVSDLVNPTPTHLLLEDFDTKHLGQFQIKLDAFISQLQNLPGFFIDESQHEMLCYNTTMYISIPTVSGIFNKSIDLKFLNVGQLNLEGELLVHANRPMLEDELRQRQLNNRLLMPLNAKPSLLAKNPRNNVYLTFDFTSLSLFDTQFERIQLIIQAIDLYGNVLKDVFSDSTTYNTAGLPIEKSLASKTFLQYYMFGPKDQFKLNLQINLPRNCASNIHLRLLFYGSHLDGRLAAGTLPMAVSFLRLIENGVLIGIGSTELFLHKVDSSSSLISLKYLKFAGTKRDQKYHANLNEADSVIPSLPVHISTLCVHYTHDLNVLALLRYTDKKQVLRAIDQLSSISGDFSLFLPHFFDKLLEKLGTDTELDRKVFGFLNFLFKRADYPMEQHLKSVIDTQLSQLNNVQVYKPFLALLNSSMISTITSQQDTAFWIDTMRGCANMTKIIVRSAASNQQLLDYRQSNSKTNSVIQHLNSEFTVLLGSLVSSLRNKTIQLVDHQWTHLNSIPGMLDVLLEFEVFEAQSLGLFVVELLRSVPDRLQTAKMEIIRAMTKSLLFRNDRIRQTTLLPEFMPIVVESLRNVSTKPDDHTKLLNMTVAPLLNILQLLRSNMHKAGKAIASELLFITNNCLLPTIRCCNASVYHGHEEIQMLSQTLFVTFIDLIDANIFALYLNSFDDETQVVYMLNELLKAIRPFTEASGVQLLNEQPLKVVLRQQCVKYANFTRYVLFDRRTFSDLQVAVWKELMNVLHSFLMNSDEKDPNLYIKRNVDLHLSAVECLRSMWFSLSVARKLMLGRNMLESVLDLLSYIQNHQLSVTLLTIFGDIMKTEGYAYSELIKERPDHSFAVYKLLHSKLMKRPANLTNPWALCSEMERELRSVVLCDQKFISVKKLNMLPRFLKLINFGREALFRDNNYEIRLIYHKFLLFWYEIDEKEMIVEYVVKLYTFHKVKQEFVEAAFSLQDYATHLQWTEVEDRLELVMLRKRLQLDTRSSKAGIKEQLYWIICDLFASASSWELAIPLLKELAQYYESGAIDYKQLSSVMGRLQDYYHSIAEKLRLNCLYFLVGFYGMQPEYLRNKQFIFRGRPVEMLDSFRQRIVQNFGCELLQSLDEDPEKLSALDGKFATVASVVPVPTSEFVRLSNAENPLLSWFYKHNIVDTFLMTRPVLKKETIWTEKFGLNEITKVWIRRSEFKLSRSLPGILLFCEVSAKQELELLNPLQSACTTISNTNDELRHLTRLVDSGFGDTYLTPLLGQLRGILQAFVGGGVKNYKIFLSDDVDELLLDEESLADKKQLKALLVQQVKLLDHGLYVHGCHQNEQSRALHDTLVDSFHQYCETIQQLCGINCTISLTQKASVALSEALNEGGGKHMKYLSRLSTDNILIGSNETQSPVQQRSASTTDSTQVNFVQKTDSVKTMTKQRLVDTDAPSLPPRRSNRHSSKLLSPRTA